MFQYITKIFNSFNRVW